MQVDQPDDENARRTQHPKDNNQGLAQGPRGDEQGPPQASEDDEEGPPQASEDDNEGPAQGPEGSNIPPSIDPATPKRKRVKVFKTRSMPVSMKVPSQDAIDELDSTRQFKKYRGEDEYEFHDATGKIYKARPLFNASVVFEPLRSTN